MRRFPFFVAPLVGIVALFFLFKLLVAAAIGLAIFGMAFAAVRRLANRGHYQPMYVAAMQQRQPLPIDPQPHHERTAFDWAPQGRIIEVI